MTTDPFTQAARAEAVRWWQTPDAATENVIERLGQHMAEWARDYLAEQKPTDVEVGAVQKCLYERTLTWVPTVEVRAALSAAREARR